MKPEPAFSRNGYRLALPGAIVGVVVEFRGGGCDERVQAMKKASRRRRVLG
jgi:hypothetical protein